MKNLIIADTGFWYALLNEDDRYHQEATNALKQLDSPLCSTWPVITEVCYLLQSRLGQKVVCEFCADQRFN